MHAVMSKIISEKGIGPCLCIFLLSFSCAAGRCSRLQSCPECALGIESHCNQVRSQKLRPNSFHSLTCLNDPIQALILFGEKSSLDGSLGNVAGHAFVQLLTMCRQLPFEDVWKLFGEGKHSNARQLYESKLAPYLTQASSNFWSKRLWYFDKGLYFQGGQVSQALPQSFITSHPRAFYSCLKGQAPCVAKPSLHSRNC